MSIKRVTPVEAAELLKQGWKYVDVRSVPEFDQGHPTGAYSVPIMHKGPGGMTANPDFEAAMTASFQVDDQLVIGCHSGKRSLRAANVLVGLGFSSVIDMRGGFAGERSPDGAVTCEGWQSAGLPVSTEAQEGRSYSEIKG